MGKGNFGKKGEFGKMKCLEKMILEKCILGYLDSGKEILKKGDFEKKDFGKRGFWEKRILGKGDFWKGDLRKKEFWENGIWK